jgi:hypothetical protein
VIFDHVNKVVGDKTGQGRLSKMRVVGNIVIGPRVRIGEVTASAARDQNFRPDFGGVIQHSDLPAPSARLYGAHQAGPASPDNDDVVIFHGRILSG